MSAPVPVVLIAPGYLIPASEYLGYAKRLASHGIAGVNVGFAMGLSQKAEGDALAAALDALPANLDAMHAGVMGHSRGGKSSVIAAAEDARFVALLGLDPVDSKPPFTTCDPVTECPDASDLAKTLKIPTGFLGETLDSTGTLQPCAPGPDNYTTFYASAPSPSFEVTLAGASHMSFIDDPSACGVPFVCTSCKSPTLSQKDALGVAYSYTAAFFLRHLRGDVGQAAFLAGADATK